MDEMAADLLRSDLIVSPPDDLESMIDSYNTTLRALVDKHVPLRTKRSQERRSARWFDRECRESKRLTRKLERRYRRVRTADAQAAWRQQFDTQRHLFSVKVYCVLAVNGWKLSAKPARPLANRQHHASSAAAAPHMQTVCSWLCQFFRSKVANIRTATASAKPPVIDPRQTPSLSQF